jgi:hypothetical protein
MKTKILLFSMALMLIIGFAVGAYWWKHRPQVIVLENGDRLTLVGVTYGKHHAPPTGKTTKPAAGTRRGGQGPQAFNTPNDTLVVWMRQEHPQNRWPNYQLYLYDKANTACVGGSGNRNWGGGGSNEIVAAQFDAFPRRQGSLILRVQEYVQNEGQVMNEKHFVISNPAHGPFEKWQTETLPATKSDDDFSVTLTKLVAGADLPYQRNQDADDAMNKGVAVTYTVQRNGSPAMNWRLVSVETSDATGNHVSSGDVGAQQDNNDTVTYHTGLWPDEAAWKVRMQFSQQKDFASNEVWSVTGLPLVAGRQQDFWNFANNFNNNRRSNTNQPAVETDLNGYHLKVYPAKQFTDQQMGNGEVGGGFYIQATPSLPSGTTLTLVKVTDNQDGEIQSNGSNTSGNGNSTFYSYQLRDLGGLTNINVTVALHRDRFVEFTVKPAKASADANN